MRQVALLAALAAAVLPQAGTAKAPPAGALRIADLSPVTIDGSNFRPREFVKLRVTVGTQHRLRMVMAQPNGSFHAVFTGLVAPAACRVAAQASGMRGTTAYIATRGCTADIGPPPIAP